MPTRLERILVYPVKSLDGMSLSSASLLESGALPNDRRYAFVDGDGKIVNAHRCAALHRLRSQFHADSETLSLSTEELPMPRQFRLGDPSERKSLAEHCSRLLATEVELAENPTLGFPDDLDAPGPTVVSTATLEAVAEWFGELSVAEVRRRFRPNLEIGGVEAFWEDRLCDAEGETVPFAIGDCVLLGVRPCQRCAVPSRSPLTGEALPGFAARFSQRREAGLPAWANRSRFDHFYRLSVNTRLAPGGGRQLQIGNEVRLVQT